MDLSHWLFTSPPHSPLVLGKLNRLYACSPSLAPRVCRLVTADKNRKPSTLTPGASKEVHEQFLSGTARASRAATMGDATAQYNLGQMYEVGEGVAQSDKQAAAWYAKAAAQGHKDAQYDLGGVAKDWAKAAEWYRKAAAQGQVNAQYLLAQLLELGGESVTKDEDPRRDLRAILKLEREASGSETAGESTTPAAMSKNQKRKNKPAARASASSSSPTPTTDLEITRRRVAAVMAVVLFVAASCVWRAPVYLVVLAHCDVGKYLA